MSSEDFTNTENNDLKKIESLMDKEKNVKIYKKLSYIRLRKLGYQPKEAYKLAHIKKSTAYYTDEKWEKGGYTALLPKERKNNNGRKTKLDNEQLEELKNILKAKGSYDETDVQKIIKENWNIKYTKTGIKNLLKSQLDINIENYKEQKRKEENNIENIINNYSNLKKEDINEINTLKECLIKEEDLFINNKLIFLLLYKLGFSLEIAADLLDKTEATGKNWLNQWERGGYSALKRKPGQGRKSYLTDQQWDEVKKN